MLRPLVVFVPTVELRGEDEGTGPLKAQQGNICRASVIK